MCSIATAWNGYVYTLLCIDLWRRKRTCFLYVWFRVSVCAVLCRAGGVVELLSKNKTRKEKEKEKEEAGGEGRVHILRLCFSQFWAMVIWRFSERLGRWGDWSRSFFGFLLWPATGVGVFLFIEDLTKGPKKEEDFAWETFLWVFRWGITKKPVWQGSSQAEPRLNHLAKLKPSRAAKPF